VGRTPGDRRLIEALGATLASVFPTVHVIDVPGTFNSLLVATVQPTRPENLAENLAALPPHAHPLLRDALSRARAQLALTPQPSFPPRGGEGAFTDDRAPVEQITNAMILQFLLQGGFSTP